jgi:hypothetical protein
MAKVIEGCGAALAAVCFFGLVCQVALPPAVGIFERWTLDVVDDVAGAEFGDDELGASCGQVEVIMFDPQAPDPGLPGLFEDVGRPVGRCRDVVAESVGEQLGLVADEILDRPGFVDRRERFWTAALSDEHYAMNRAAVAERDGEMAGIAMAGPAGDTDAHWRTRSPQPAPCISPRKRTR